MKCGRPSTKTGKPCAMPCGHPREQHLDENEVNAETNAMSAAFGFGYMSGRGKKKCPHPTAARREHRDFAQANGYFWLPCPRCGEWFGGHESIAYYVRNVIACCPDDGADPTDPVSVERYNANRRAAEALDPTMGLTVVT